MVWGWGGGEGSAGAKQMNEFNCAQTGSSGRVQFSDVSPGSHRVVIRARTVAGDRAVERRNVFVCKLDVHKVETAL